MPEDSGPASPTVRRRQLAETLRKLREQAELTHDQVIEEHDLLGRHAMPEDDQQPLWSPEEFEVDLAEMVAEEAPRLFAVVREYGDRVDAEISAWGMAFSDHADAIGLGGAVYLGMRSAERALWFNRAGGRVTPRLVWWIS